MTKNPYSFERKQKFQYHLILHLHPDWGRLGKQMWGLLKGRLCFCPQNAKLNLSSKPWESERLLNGDPEKFYRSTWKWNMNNSITTITNCSLTGRRVTGLCHHRTESSRQSCWATATYSKSSKVTLGPAKCPSQYMRFWEVLGFLAFCPRLSIILVDWGILRPQNWIFSLDNGLNTFQFVSFGNRDVKLYSLFCP